MATRRSQPNRAQQKPSRGGVPDRPIPPAELRPANPTDHDLETEATFKALGFMEIMLPERVAEAVEFKQCRFRAATLAGSQLTRVRMTDCLLEACDWSNLHGDGGTCDRVAVTGSRMTGLSWADGLLRDVSFQECKLDLTNWRFADFKAVAFTDCNLARADFTGADLRGASFTRCDLAGAQFSRATMRGTRLRGCELGGVGGITSWEGAVVHRDDLLELSHVLAAAMGIAVEGFED